MEFARVIREARKAKDLSQLDVATELHIEQVSVSAWERDKAVPNVLNLRALAVLLDLDQGELLHLAGEAAEAIAAAKQPLEASA